MSPENVDVFHADGDRASNGGSSRPSHTINFAEPLPELHTPHKRRQRIILIGVTLVIVDLCALPIAYYYAFKFGTKLSMQDSMLSPSYCAGKSVLTWCSIWYHYRNIRLDQFRALLLQITQVVPIKGVDEMEAGGMDTMGNGMCN